MTLPFDTLLKGGRVIDPFQKIDAQLDVAIKDGKIQQLAADIPAGQAREVIQVGGKLVIPGMIDNHAHVFRHIGGLLGGEADWVGIQSGVTTLIEQGSCSAATFPGFNEYIVKTHANNIYAFLAPYAAGAVGGFMFPDQFTPNTIDVNASLRTFEQYPGIVKGMKFWAEQDGLLKYGTACIEKTVHIARTAGVPVYVHLGELLRVSDEVKRQFPASRVLDTILPFLQPGDIFAHTYTDQAGGFFSEDLKVRPQFLDAKAAGFHFDLGYGAATTLRLMRAGIEQDFIPDTLGADIHSGNTRVPDPGINPANRGRYGGMPSVVNGMNLLLAFGQPLLETVARATTNPARIFLGMEAELGSLQVGTVADITVLNDERGKWTIPDSSGDRLTLERLLMPAFCLKDGRRFAADSPILYHPDAA